MTSITSKLPSSMHSNARDIVRSLLKRFYKKPSDSLAQRIEAITGIEADYSDHDQDFFEPRNNNN